MPSKSPLILFIPVLTILWSCKNQGNQLKTESSKDRFQVGQIWKYKNRIGEEASTITIWKISQWDNGDTIIHIRIDSLKMDNFHAAFGDTNSIKHVPILKKEFSESITELIGITKNLPDTLRLYREWRETRHAGYWKMDLEKVINRIEQEVQKAQIITN